MTKIDRILISVDDNPLYIQFLPVVSMAWQKLLGIKPTLAYVSENGSTPEWMKEYCQDIITYSFTPEIKRGSTATFCARLLMRSLFGNEICMISDLDMIPLQKDIFTNLPKEFNENNFLSIGYDIYENGDGNPGDPASRIPNIGKFPSCYTAASSIIWKEIINPSGLNDKDLVKTWHYIRDYDNMEAMINAGYFCDESLIRALYLRWNKSRDRLVGVRRGRGEVVHVANRVDRSNWIIDYEKLNKRGYIDAHCPRPLKDHKEKIKPLTDYLNIPFVLE